MSEILTPEVINETALQVLDEREESLKALASQFHGLKVDGLDDKEGFKKVKEARLTLKNERVAIENVAKQLREPAVRFQKAVITREKQLIGIIEPLEDELHAEEKRIEILKEEARKEKEMWEAKQLQDRLNKLAEYNFAADWVEIKHMTDDQFEERLALAKKLHEEEQAHQAEIRAEEERKRREEAERLQKEREELEDRRREFERMEQERQEAESKRIRLEEIRQEQIRKEEEERQAAIRAEREKIEAERRAIEEERRKHEEAVRLEAAKKEAAERARLEEQDRIKREAEEKAERERLAKLEAERQDALKPDKEKLRDWAHQIVNLSNSEPVLKDQAATDLATKISQRLYSVAEELNYQISEL